MTHGCCASSTQSGNPAALGLIGDYDVTISVRSHPNRGKFQHFDNENDLYYQPVVDGKEHSFVAETEDMALLIGLGIKYDGLNSQFPIMAARMLRIETEWSK